MSADCKNRIIVMTSSILVLSISLYSCLSGLGAINSSLRAINSVAASTKKKEVVPAVPTVTTTDIINITVTTASGGGYIADQGTSPVISRGVCWGSRPTPTILGNKTSDGAGVGHFSSNVTELSGATRYFVRAYATNIVGTGYGEAKFFTTLGRSPTSKVKAATDINTSIATLNGSVNANYLSTVVSFEYGKNKRYGNTASANENPISGNTLKNVSANISGLIIGTIYHYRIKATNSHGTTFSKDMTFKTKVSD